ncbi:hypothetical protein [Sporomusa aerivorans]|uniref:hypothetical protein n=1 Tax=Sporomusa aerivorans TaxID=204936 RepID=UPI00352BB2B4
MNGLIKNTIVYSLVGIMQFGTFAAVAEAAPLYNDGSQRIVQLDRHDRHYRRNDERRREHDERMRREQERHDKEMRRRAHESERHWRERQRREDDRHKHEMREIAALLIGIVIGSAASND